MTSENDAGDPDECTSDPDLDPFADDRVIGLTPRRFQEKLRQLRATDPVKAKRVERRVRKKYGRVFPRSQIPSQGTSFEIRARVELLPQNPHLQKDLLRLRDLLGVPDGGIQVIEGSPLWELLAEVVDEDSVRNLCESALADEWFGCHLRAGECGPTGFVESLPPDLQASAIASARRDWPPQEAPEWLERPPEGPAPYNKPSVPILWAVGRLIERYRLPWHVSGALRDYLLSGNPRQVEGLEWGAVRVRPVDAPGLSAALFEIIVPFDEDLTKEEWEQIWARHVKPWQDFLLEQRGQKPQGKRSRGTTRLWRAIPSYQQMVEEGWTVGQLLRPGNLEDAMADLDDRAIRAMIKDLDQLLRPED